MYKSAGPEPDPALFQGVFCAMRNYLLIGTILKPQGVRGECKIRPYAADLDLFSSWNTLYLEENGSYTPVSCVVRRIHEGFVYAVLDDPVALMGMHVREENDLRLRIALKAVRHALFHGRRRDYIKVFLHPVLRKQHFEMFFMLVNDDRLLKRE